MNLNSLSPDAAAATSVAFSWKIENNSIKMALTLKFSLNIFRSVCSLFIYLRDETSVSLFPIGDRTLACGSGSINTSSMERNDLDIIFIRFKKRHRNGGFIPFEKLLRDNNVKETR